MCGLRSSFSFRTPPEPQPEEVTFVQVLKVNNPGDIAMLKSLLGAEGVTYFFQGEHSQRAESWVVPVVLMVREDQAPEVKRMLKNLKYL